MFNGSGLAPAKPKNQIPKATIASPAEETRITSSADGPGVGLRAAFNSACQRLS